jgi:hypothetical protein
LRERLRTHPLLLAAAALVSASPLAAQDRPEDYHVENLAFQGAGVFLFGLVPARSEPTLGAQLRVDLGEVAPSLRIAPSLTYWGSEYRDSELEELARRVEALCERGGSPCPGIDLGEVRVSDLSLGVDAQYLWTTSLGVEPYAGAGVSLHLLNGSGDLIEDTFVEDILDGITPGVSAHAGIEIPLASGLRLHGELRAELAGSASWLGAGVGALWHVGGRP